MPSIKLIPLYLLYLSTFGLTALGKLSPALRGHVGAPDWFVKQFEQSVLNAFPGAITLSFYLIATLEAIVALGILIGLLRREFLPGRKKTGLLSSLLVAELVFVALGFGLRLTQDYRGAFEAFVYFGVTLLAFWYVEGINETCN